MKIFNILADLCQKQPNYIEAFVQVLQNCVKPFLLDKSTDAEIYSSALVAFYADFGTDQSPVLHALMRSLGYLLRVPIKRIQQCLLETLYKSIQSSNKSPVSATDYDGLKPAPLDYLLRIQCTSDLCETLVKVKNDDDLHGSFRRVESRLFQTLSIVENDLSLRILILKLLQLYSSQSRQSIFVRS